MQVTRNLVHAFFLVLLIAQLSGCLNRSSDPPTTPRDAGLGEDATDLSRDVSLDPTMDATPGGLTIYDIQNSESSDYPGENSVVTVRGIISAIDTHIFDARPTSVGDFYIQHPDGGPYSGIFCFNQYFTSSDSYAVDYTNLMVGQAVEVTGEYLQFHGLSQIKVSEVRIIDTALTHLIPERVDAADVATGGELAREYQSVLVEVLDVTVTNNSIGFGKFVVSGGLEIDDELTALAPFPNVGTQYERIAGVLTYTYSAVQLNPRSAQDMTIGEEVEPGELSIYDLQDSTSSNHPGEGAQVTVLGVITAIDTHMYQDNNTSVGSFYIQDPEGGPYSGIFCFNTYYTTSTSHAVDHTELSMGQTVAVTGTYLEYYDLSQIQVSSVEVVDSSITSIVPEIVDPADVATGGDLAEQYEGVLVEVINVVVTNNSIGFGKFVVSGGLEIDDELTAFDPFPSVGTQYSRIAGVLTYTYSAVQLNPRGPADMTLGDDVEPESLTIYDIQDTSSIDHPSPGTTVTVSGVITAIDTHMYQTNKTSVGSFYIQDEDGGPYSGIYCFNQYYTESDEHAVDYTSLSVGQTVEVTGVYLEYYDELSQIRVTAVEVTDASITVITPETVDPADVATGGALAEQYEGVLVEVLDVTVTGTLTHGKFQVTGGLEIDDELTSFDYPNVGAVYSRIAGVLTYTYDAVQLNPRGAADITLLSEGEALTIYDVANVASERHPGVGSTVRVQGIITAIDTQMYGTAPRQVGHFFIQHPDGGLFSGIYCYNYYTSATTSYAVDISGFEVGDTVEVEGEYTIFYGLREILVTSLVLVDDTTSPPAPVAVTIANVGTSRPQASEYQGVLVVLSNLEVTAVPDEFGTYEVNDGGDYNMLVVDDLYKLPYDPTIGSTFTSITGVLSYSYNEVRLNPRFAADYVD